MSDVETVEAVYQAFAEHDLDGLLEMVHDDVVVLQDERLPWGGRHEGRDGVATFAIALVSTIDSDVVRSALFEASGKVIQVGHTRGTVRSNGAEFDIPEVHVWSVRDGKVATAEFLIDTPAMLSALEAT